MSITQRVAKLNHSRGMMVIVDDEPVDRLGVAKTSLNAAGEVTRPYECVTWNMDTGTVTNGIEWLTDAQIEKARSAFTWTH